MFELTPESGAPWTEKILYAFVDGTDGGNPYAPLILDKSGNLYGTATQGGGPNNGGTVFKLTAGSTIPWTETTLHSLTRGADGGSPMGGLVLDSAGNLYGTTASYGSENGGVVFELTRGASGRHAHLWVRRQYLRYYGWWRSSRFRDGLFGNALNFM